MVDRIKDGDQGNACGRRDRRSARHGFTLIELLIALVLLDVGLLALVGIGARIARDSRTTRAAAVALSVLSARLERSASAPCRLDASGTAAWNDGVAERWTETIGANGTRTISDTATFPTSRGVRTVALRTAARC